MNGGGGGGALMREADGEQIICWLTLTKQQMIC